jgi:ferredoxin-type protein NapH
VLIPLLNNYDMRALTGNMVAFNAAGVPLADPLAMLQAAVGSFSVTAVMITGAGLVLLAAALLGPAFCGWLCPFGLLSELVQCLRNKKSGVSGSAKSSGAVFFRPVLLKSGLVAAGLLLILTALPLPVLTQLSMPAWITRFWQHAILLREILWPALWLVPAVLLAEFVLGGRFWCRYLCPQSLLISLAGLAGLALPKRLQVRFTPKACNCPASDRACLAACSLNLNPRKPVAAQMAQCVNCGDCVEACKKRGRALGFKFSAKD